MWDVLKWQHDTLSVAWWALIAFAVLVIIAAGSRAARKWARPGRFESRRAAPAACLSSED